MSTHVVTAELLGSIHFAVNVQVKAKANDND